MYIFGFDNLDMIYRTLTAKLGNGVLIENKKEFLNMLPVLKSQVKTYVKDNRLSVKSEEDLRLIAKYYNNLIFSNF